MPIADILGAPSGLGYFGQSPHRFALKGHKISAQGIALRHRDRFRTKKDVWKITKQHSSLLSFPALLTSSK